LVVWIVVPLTLTLVAWFALHNMAAIIGGIVGGLVVAFLISSTIKEKVKVAVEQVVEEFVAPKPKYGSETREDLEEDVITFNLGLRTSDMDKDLIIIVEEILDLFVEALPQMNKRYTLENFTWEMNRIFHEHLPTQVKEFLDMSPQQQTDGKELFTTVLQELLKTVKRGQEVVASDEKAEFEKMAQFIKTKYQTI